MRLINNLNWFRYNAKTIYLMFNLIKCSAFEKKKKNAHSELDACKSSQNWDSVFTTVLH